LRQSTDVYIDFWQSPSHFSAVSTPLLTLLASPVLPTTTHVSPALVELAAAADSPEHHKTLNSAILSLFRSPEASVRLSAIRTQQALVAKLGEEWLGNLPEMLPFISEAMEDDDETVEREVQRLVLAVEEVLGESIGGMLT
jgi:U3 small nucleolar RNA-associated protein 10